MSYLDKNHVDFNNIGTLFKKKRKSFQVDAHLSFVDNMPHDSDLPMAYLAIQHVLLETLTTTSLAIPFHITEYAIYRDARSPIKFLCFSNNNQTYELSPGISIKQSYCRRESEKDKAFFTYGFEVSSRKDDYKVVDAFVTNCIEAYKKNKQDNVTQRIFALRKFHESKYAEPTYNEYPLETFKTFDNLFFDEKRDLLKRIDNFENNKQLYEKTGMPYAFGLMFCGEPGTGKTSCVKAVAKYTGRHIVQINMSNVSTAEQLKQVFMCERLNSIEVPNSKRLYVFEEVDCGKWKKIMQCRDMAAARDEIVVIDKDKKVVTAVDITLGDFLEILDGVIEIKGRMFIMTTNKINEIDKAVIRPGRVDMVIKFGKMSSQDINNLYTAWFGEPFPGCLDGVHKKFTQAEIGNLFTSSNMDLIMETLKG